MTFPIASGCIPETLLFSGPSVGAGQARVHPEGWAVSIGPWPEQWGGQQLQGTGGPNKLWFGWMPRILLGSLSVSSIPAPLHFGHTDPPSFPSPPGFYPECSPPPAPQ